MRASPLLVTPVVWGLVVVFASGDIPPASAEGRQIASLDRDAIEVPTRLRVRRRRLRERRQRLRRRRRKIRRRVRRRRRRPRVRRRRRVRRRKVSRRRRSRRARRGQRRRRSPLFSFAVVSDTHDYARCALGQGQATMAAAKFLGKRRPAFVIGLGDLIAGGGDCKLHKVEAGRKHAGVYAQLREFRDLVLRPMHVPFVPVGGNHDLGHLSPSVDKRRSREAWNHFWRRSRRYVLAPARRSSPARSYRFTFRGIGFSIISYYGTWGLAQRELAWIDRHVKRGDLVFRHINPFGITCVKPGDCGFSIRGASAKEVSALTRSLRRKGVTALFSGHTHGFYDGVCGGLRFINTGSLGSRSMEYLKGWAKSPYRKRQAFVWVDVYSRRRIHVTFFVWSQRHGKFRRFSKRHFPRRIVSKAMRRPGGIEGVAATCRAMRW